MSILEIKELKYAYGKGKMVLKGIDYSLEAGKIYATPQTVSVSQTLAEGNVTLAWSGAGNGAGNPISSYEIQYSESTDAGAWGT